VAALVLTGSGPVQAHGGGTNAEGCHNNRKTGDYHCHGGRSAESSGSSPRSARSTSRPTARPMGLSSAGSGTYFANCSAARAAGRSNIRRGESGYGSHLDRDGDGLACER
jgi:hypothetical protein